MHGTKLRKRNRSSNEPLVEQFLLNGSFEEGEIELTKHLKSNPDDDQARFGLGVLQFILSLQTLVQEFYRYGIKENYVLAILPPLRLPIPQNPTPDKITYQASRQIICNLIENLTKAAATLTPIKDDYVTLPIHFGLVNVDMTGKSDSKRYEKLWKLYASSRPDLTIKPEEAHDFLIKFDRGDVHWLRGYCHLIMTFCEIFIAHDSEKSFEHTAHISFSNVESQYDFLNTKPNQIIFDYIALIHLLKWKVTEPSRLKLALSHLETVVQQNKIMWKYIMAETEDDCEWIPNPNQTGVIPNMQVTEGMVASWLELMDVIEKVLAGDLLIGFWRGDKENYGINIRRVFLESKEFDLILWIQGTALVPFLEEGETTSIETWISLQREFGHQFPGFVLLFN